MLMIDISTARKSANQNCWYKDDRTFVNIFFKISMMFPCLRLLLWIHQNHEFCFEHRTVFDEFCFFQEEKLHFAGKFPVIFCVIFKIFLIFRVCLVMVQFRNMLYHMSPWCCAVALDHFDFVFYRYRNCTYRIIAMLPVLNQADSTRA